MTYPAIVIGTGMVFVSLWFVAPAFISGKYTPGDFLVIWGYYNAIAASSSYLGRMWLSIQENVTGLEWVFAILDSPVEAIEVAPESTSLGADFGMQQGIRLKDVDFDYPGGTAALRGINFEGLGFALRKVPSTA